MEYVQLDHISPDGAEQSEECTIRNDALAVIASSVWLGSLQAATVPPIIGFDHPRGRASH